MEVFLIAFYAGLGVGSATALVATITALIWKLGRSITGQSNKDGVTGCYPQNWGDLKGIIKWQ